MKKLYSIALAAAVAFTASAQGELVKDLLPSKKETRALKLEKAEAQTIQKESRASYTAEDVAGTYYASASSFLRNGTDMKNQELTVTVNTSGDLEFVGFYSTYAIKGTFDAATATITIPNNQFVLHNTYYNKDVVYNGYTWPDKDLVLVDGGIKVKYDGKNLIFDQENYLAFEIVGEGYFALWGEVKALSEAPQEDFSDHDADVAWQNVGTATFTPGWLSGFFTTSDISKVSYEVPLQKHPTLEGVYRLENPYSVETSPLVTALTNGKYTFKPGYIKFNIANADAPFVYNEVFSGLVTDEGEGFYCYDILGFYGMDMLETIKKQLPDALSTYADNVLTITTPLFGYGATDMNAAYNWKTIVPAKIDLKNLAGIDDIEIEGAQEAPVYYNLQGVRVDNPENGLFIEVRGNKAAKVLK